MNKQTGFRLVFVVCLVLLALAPAALLAQNFVYVNNNVFGPNTVSGFSASLSGGVYTLTPIPGSPFSTGGTGGGVFFALNELAVFSDGRFLFATDEGSNDVAVFAINQTTGALTPVPGSPFSTGQNDSGGMSLAEAVAPNGKILYAANFTSGTISVFKVANNGTLTLTPFSPVPAGGNPDGINVRPDQKYLAVALGAGGVNEVAVFAIGPGGTLTAVPGSPFAGTGGGGLTGVSYKCGSKVLFGAEANATGTIVDVYDVASNGALTTIPGDPFTFDSGTLNSNVVLSSPYSQLVFVSNQLSSTITDFTVGPHGSLTPVSGAPFYIGISDFPAGMAVGSVTDSLTGIPTTFLYVADIISDAVTVFSVAPGGTLSLVPASPFFTGAGGGPVSVAVHPPLGCR